MSEESETPVVQAPKKGGRGKKAGPAPVEEDTAEPEKIPEENSTSSPKKRGRAKKEVNNEENSAEAPQSPAKKAKTGKKGKK